jgi:hypothetical protein
LEEKVAAAVSKVENTAVGIFHAHPAAPLHPQKLALTSPTSCNRSVGIVLSLTKTTDLFISYCYICLVFSFCLYLFYSFFLPYSISILYSVFLFIPIALFLSFYLCVLFVSSSNHLFRASVGITSRTATASTLLTYLLRGLSPQANYTDRATAACRRS